MATNLLFTSGNYIIAEKNNGVDPIQRTEYAIGHTVYTRGFNGQLPTPIDQFQLLEGGISPKASGRLIIPLSEITQGDWYKEDGITLYDETTFTEFLRENSGFSSALGGSGAGAVVGDVLTFNGKKWVAQMPSGGASLATADQLINQTGTRSITLGGSLSTDNLEVEAASGTSVLKIRGDNTIYVPGYLGVGTTNLGPSYGNHKINIYNPNNSGGVNIQQAGGNGKAILMQLTATNGSQYGLYVTSTTSNVNSNGSHFNMSGGGGGTKNAINIVNGTIQMPAAGAVNGCKIGTGPTQIFSFWGATPIGQPTALTAANATPTDGTITTADNIINNLRRRLDELESKLSAAAGGSGLIA